MVSMLQEAVPIPAEFGARSTACSSPQRWCRLRPRVVPSPLAVTAALAVSRRGARLAEVISISQHQMLRPRRLLRQKGRLKRSAAAAAAAAAARRVEPAAFPAEVVQREDRPRGSGPGGSAGASVVSAPDWPPVKQQGATVGAASGAGVEQQQQQEYGRRRKRRPPQHEDVQPSAAPPRGASSGGQQADDVRAFLRGSSGGTRLRLEAWDHADMADKQLQAKLLRKVCYTPTSMWVGGWVGVAGPRRVDGWRNAGWAGWMCRVVAGGVAWLAGGVAWPLLQGRPPAHPSRPPSHP